MDRVLVTGASGFIGSYIVSQGLELGYEVWAAVRKSSSRAYLKDERIKFVELSLDSEERLVQELQATGVRFDYVVHAAGATKCLRESDFYRTNTEGTKNLVNALVRADMVPKRFVFVSSLSVFGAVREEPVRRRRKGYGTGDTIAEDESIYSPILLTDSPRPNTAYGRSKLAAEEFLRGLDVGKFPYVILRPTGVYGPREKDYFVMAKSIAGHTDFAVGYSPQEITFVYVMDVVQAVYRSMTAEAAVGKAYFLSDGRVYNSRRFSDLLQRELGNPWVLHVRAPLWFLRVICWCGNMWMRITGRLTVLNNDKFNILSQRNWRCDIGPARHDLGFVPEWSLEDGVRSAVRWYRENGWL